MTKAEVSWDIVASPINEDEEDSGQKFYGVTTGTVMDVADPQGLGRVRVQLSMMPGGDLSDWARIATPMAGSALAPTVAGYGFYFIPDIGTEVLVAFEHGDMKHPFVIGCLWNNLPPAARPPLPTPLAQIRGIRTPIGNQIAFTEGPPSLTIQSGLTPPVVMPAPPVPVAGGLYPFQTISLSPDGINMVGNTLKVLSGGIPPASLTVTPAGITLQSGGSSIAITPAGIVIAATSITIFGSAAVLIN